MGGVCRGRFNGCGFNAARFNGSFHWVLFSRSFDLLSSIWTSTLLPSVK